MQILKEEVRSRIVDASAKIFVTKGVEKTTIRDIAKEANASIGNIYRYFRSKDEIVIDLMHQFENRLKEFDKMVDIDLFSHEDKKIEDFIDGIVNLMKEQYLDMKLICISNSEQVNETKKLIINAISKRIQYRLKKVNVDKMMAKTIAHSTFEGIRLIISESKSFNSKVEEHLKKYLMFELKNIVPRIEGV